MKPKLIFLFLLLALPTAGLAQTDLKSYLHMTNMFDSGRKPVPAAATPAPTPRPKAESLTLTGVLHYGQKDVAFFSGSRTEWSASVENGGSIAGMKLEDINKGGVSLGGMFVPVGTSISKVGGGAWGKPATAAKPTNTAPSPVLSARRTSAGQGGDFAVSSTGGSRGRFMRHASAKPAASPGYEMVFPAKMAWNGSDPHAMAAPAMAAQEQDGFDDGSMDSPELAAPDFPPDMGLAPPEAMMADQGVNP